MKYILGLLVFLLATVSSFAQHGNRDEQWKTLYRATPTKYSTMIHTKLEANIDFQKAQLNGKVWLTLRPFFYSTDSVVLDAKGMDIHEVALWSTNGQKTALRYQYNNAQLTVRLNKTYKSSENYVLYVRYTAKPNEWTGGGSAAITDAKGMYFINPKGEEAGKPTQLWTQGETEATSVWVPVIDKPNQKTTHEFYLTYPEQFVSLSNGTLVSSVKNKDKTKTDYWKMDLPHAPYLFFIGIGDYAIVKDTYKGKEVSYYVEKPYEKVARKIFGNTPEMMRFFSEKLGVEYPWNKYVQIVSRDYVSGAMENTTAVIHQETAQQDARELIDGNVWEGTIAHELFHHWFGNLVTCESWSNLSMNESFADYSQLLWAEYKYGKDAGLEENRTQMMGYLSNPNEHKKNLIRFYYKDKEDMFDAVSYNKGGRILHMLRHYIGDDAFFKSLQVYLQENKFGTGEAHQLRLAFEKVTGKDLNWFFNQWFFGYGHPKLTIKSEFEAGNGRTRLIVEQTQDSSNLFKLPVWVDIYEGSNKKREMIWVKNKVDTFYFATKSAPSLINFDAEKVLLGEKKESKSLDEYLFQYINAGNYIDRREAIEFAASRQSEEKAQQIMMLAIEDKYEGLRALALSRLDMNKSAVRDATESKLMQIAQKDAKAVVRGRAIEALGKIKKEAHISLFEKAVFDSSYSVAGYALEALQKQQPEKAWELVKKIAQEPAKGKLGAVISDVMYKQGDESAFDIIANKFDALPFGQAKFEGLTGFSNFLAKVKDASKVKRGVDMIVKFREAIPSSYRDQTDPYINDLILKGLLRKKETEKKEGNTSTDLQEVIDYIQSKLPTKG